MPNSVAPRPNIPSSPGDAIGTDNTSADASININLDGLTGNTNNTKGGQTVALLLLFALLSIAPSLIMMLTSFTRIVIVLSLTRNALGLQMAPPNQVIVGLSMFLTFFVMAPTLSTMNKDALQPLLKGQITTQQAYDRAVVPLQAFMLKQTGKSELALFTTANASATGENPAPGNKVSMVALVPAFILSELKAAFIIGFVIFIPFLIIDLIVSSSLMSMGMFMLPPVLVSLPFKLMLFVLVDGWSLIVESLLKSFNT
ncbi:MAG: flagellar type III secretion system pore protein FliP [Acidimicrobiia bacterium]